MKTKKFVVQVNTVVRVEGGYLVLSDFIGRSRNSKGIGNGFLQLLVTSKKCPLKVGCVLEVRLRSGVDEP